MWENQCFEVSLQKTSSGPNQVQNITQKMVDVGKPRFWSWCKTKFKGNPSANNNSKLFGKTNVAKKTSSRANQEQNKNSNSENLLFQSFWVNFETITFVQVCTITHEQILFLIFFTHNWGICTDSAGLESSRPNPHIILEKYIWVTHCGLGTWLGSSRPRKNSSVLPLRVLFPVHGNEDGNGDDGDDDGKARDRRGGWGWD